MGLESFQDDPEDEHEIIRSGEQVRPYVDEETHKLVSNFAKHSGINVSTAYDLLGQTVLRDDELTTLMLEKSSTNGGEVTPFKMSLVNQIADKTEELREFPSRSDINEDEDMYGYAVYIDALGSINNIKDMIQAHRPEAYKHIDGHRKA